MTRPKPNLFLIGAAKAGTTSLHHHLSRHPDIHMSDPKEPGFFVEELDYYPKDEEWYLSLFEEGARVRYRGESSTHYTKLPTYPGVAPRIADYCDSPRLIYLMRDPIERAISHYWHNTRQHAEFRTPLRAMKENVEYRAFGDYARQLEAYFQVFEREGMYLTTFERLVAEPRRTARKIFEWLDLDPDEVPGELPTKNTRPAEVEQFLGGERLARVLYSDAWDSLSPLVPQKLKDLGKKVTWETVRPSEHRMDEVVGFLRPWARDAMSRAADLLGRDFPEWKTTRDER